MDAMDYIDRVMNDGTVIREYIGPEYTNKLHLDCPRCGQEHLVDALPWLVDGSPAPEHQDCPAR